MYGLVVFDMAGTTIVDRGEVAASFAKAFQLNGVDVPVEATYPVMGYRKKEAILRLLDAFHPLSDRTERSELTEAIHDCFEDIMVMFYAQDAGLSPMHGALELFEALRARGVKVALNTGFTRRITQTMLERLGWEDDPRIDFTICSDEVPEGRPAPFMIQELMRRSGVEHAASVVKVGDTEVDILEGRNAGCGMVLSVATGNSSREKLMEYCPDAVADSLDEIGQILFQRLV